MLQGTWITNPAKTFEQEKNKMQLNSNHQEFLHKRFQESSWEKIHMLQ